MVAILNVMELVFTSDLLKVFTMLCSADCSSLHV